MDWQRWIKGVSQEHLFFVLRSLIVAHLSEHSDSWEIKAQAGSWSLDTTIDRNGIGIDSLDLVAIASRVNQMFHLHEAGTEDYLLARRRFADWAAIIQDAWAQGVSKIQFYSSGSTHIRTSSSHSLASLLQEIESIDQFLPSVARFHGYVPLHHIYGFLFGFLLPVCRKAAFSDHHLQPVIKPLAPDDAVISFPDHVSLMLDNQSNTMRAGTIVSSSAPMPQSLWEQMDSASVKNCVEVYGSTETGGIGFRFSGQAPFQLMAHWQAGVNKDGMLQKKTLDEDLLCSSDPRVFALQDQLQWIDDQKFLVLGRKDAVVQVGGVNVNLARIREMMRNYPGIRDCAIRAMTPGEGHRLKAFLVLEHETAGENTFDEQRFLNDLKAWMADTLTECETPARIRIGEQLPRNAMGKPKDWKA